MSENHEGHVHTKVRNIWSTVLDDGPGGDDGTFVAVDHLYLPEGSLTCEDCGGVRSDPGMVTLVVGDECAFLDAEVALTLANRLQRAASLVLEAGEQPADIERDMARFAATAQGDQS